MIIVDNYHKVSSSGVGDNYHLNLDGILFLGTIWFLKEEKYFFITTSGGVRQSMWGDIPKSLNSHFGFQGCLSSLELNGEMIDPLKVVLKTEICCYLKQEKK